MCVHAILEIYNIGQTRTNITNATKLLSFVTGRVLTDLRISKVITE